MEWKSIKGYEDKYWISSTGLVKSDSRILKAYITKKGYLRITLYKSGRKNHTIHRLVAEAFIPNPNSLPEINHKDGNKLNNQAGNLEWCTHQQNIDHAWTNGLRQSMKGEKSSFSKLNELQVRIIRRLKGDMTQKEIGKIFNVTRGNISNIQTSRKWSR